MSLNESSANRADWWVVRITGILARLMRWISLHWLFLVNVAVGVYALLPFLAPTLMQGGYERAANLIYAVYRPLCHQLPERSFFLFGGRWAYSYDQLETLLAGADVPGRYIGNLEIGFKVAICQRDVGIYLVMWFSGLLFALLRAILRPLPFRLFALMIAPMAVDGLGQLLRLWTSSVWSRLLTGGLFGLACVWLAYPYLEQGMTEVRLGTSNGGLPAKDGRWAPKS